MTRRARLLLVAPAAVLAALVLAAPAGAAGTAPAGDGTVLDSAEGWVITDYTVSLEVTEDADLLVTEDIRLDFGTLQRRGIFRYLPLWENLPDPLPPESRVELPEGADPDDYHRVLELDRLEVSVPSGAPDDVDLEGPNGETDGNVVIRIGDPDVFVSGPQQYRISYRVRGALNAFDDGHTEVFWDAIGTDWGVPILQASATLAGPAMTEAVCFQGREFSEAPCEATLAGDVARFAATGPLRNYEGMTVGVAFAPSAVDVPPPVVDRKPSLARTFLGRAAVWPLTGLTALLGVAGIAGLGWREGRDRVTRGAISSHGHVDPARAPERRRGLFEGRLVPVEYRPPDGLRPAQLGLIVDERVDDVDIAATLVDLAVRGHLTIEELDSGGWFRKADWQLRRGDQPQDEPNAYERILLDGLFDARETVKVSELKGTFHKDYQKVAKAIYEDGQSRRWFARRPDHARGIWVGAGLGLAALGVGLTVLLAVLDTRVALAGIPVVLAGLVLAAVSGAMPRRTPSGSRLLTRTLGFREFVTRAETGRMAFAEAENIFVSYLPYAVVFGAVDKWAEAFAEIGLDPGDAVSGFYTSYGTFSLMRFSSGMNEFSSSVGPAMSQVPQSSGGSGGGFSGGGSFGGGGFSGGGFGGGGGGSW